MRQLTAFAKAFPELTKLSLAFWDLPVTPIELANLPSTDSRRSLPAYSTLLDFLRCTKVTEVQVDWRAPTSEYWGWSVRLHRVGDIFEDEAFDSEGKQSRFRRSERPSPNLLLTLFLRRDEPVGVKR